MTNLLMLSFHPPHRQQDWCKSSWLKNIFFTFVFIFKILYIFVFKIFYIFLFWIGHDQFADAQLSSTPPAAGLAQEHMSPWKPPAVWDNIHHIQPSRAQVYWVYKPYIVEQSAGVLSVHISHTLFRGHSARGVARKAGKHCYGSLLCALCYGKHCYGKHYYGKHYYGSLDRGHYHHQPWDIWSQLKLESVVGSDHNNSSRCKIAKDSDVRNFRGLEGGGGKYLCIVQGRGGFSQLFMDLPHLAPNLKTRILFCVGQCPNLIRMDQFLRCSVSLP